MAIASLLTLRPWCDEAWFSSPALNLLTKGHMGTSVLDPTSTFRSVQLVGIDEYTYWIMPLYILAQAAWYEIVGFGLPQMRALSLIAGLVALVAWGSVVHSLLHVRAVSILSVALLAIDFTFLWSASAGRMDMMAAALAFTGMALFLRLRTRSLDKAVFLGNGLVAAAVFTHPVSVMALVALVFLMAYFDMRSLRTRHALLSIVPYVTGAALWSIYVLRNVAVFRAQFGGNASDRWGALAAPLSALLLEIRERYLYNFGFAPHDSGISRVKVLVFLIYLLGAVACIAHRGIRSHRGVRALLALTGIYFLLLAFLDGFRQLFYLVHVMPMLASLLAIGLHAAWQSRAVRTPVLVAVACGLIAVQLSVVGSRVVRNPYGQSYLKTGEFLRSIARPGDLIMASAEWAFQLGFDGGLVDDFRLGFRSGKRPDLIVLDERRYAEWIGHLREEDAPNHEYVQRLLIDDFRMVYDSGFYRIYARRAMPSRILATESVGK